MFVCVIPATCICMWCSRKLHSNNGSLIWCPNSELGVVDVQDECLPLSGHLFKAEVDILGTWDVE